MAHKLPPATSHDIVRFEIEGVTTCRSCGTLGYAGERYCSRCGASFAPKSESGQPVSLRRCPDCREPLHHPIAFFCPWCGTSLAEESGEASM